MSNDEINLKNIINYVLYEYRKNPLTIEDIYSCLSSNYGIELTIPVKKEVLSILSEGLNNYNYFMENDRYCLIDNSDYRVGIYYNLERKRDVVPIAFYNSKQYLDSDGNYKLFVNKAKICVNFNDVSTGDVVLLEKNKSSFKIVKVLYRANSVIYGKVTCINNIFYLEPFDRSFSSLTVQLEGDNFSIGDIVTVQLKKDKGNGLYTAEVVEQVCTDSDFSEETMIEAAKLGMPVGYSKESIEQSNMLPSSITDKDKIGRKNLANFSVFSIDGEKSKDKDDAVYLKRLENGNFYLIVNITDIPSFISLDSPLGADAFRKGNSNYSRETFEAQFPKNITNWLLSLNEGVERLTFSGIFKFDENCNLLNSDFFSAYIQSRLSMTYEDVNKLFAGTLDDKKYKPFINDLFCARELAYLLRNKRIENGALIFQQPKQSFIYDENLIPIDSVVNYPGDAEIIIEEFMLVYNTNLAKFAHENKIPFVYRVLPKPSFKRLSKFLKLLDSIGEPFPYSVSDIIPKIGFRTDYFQMLIRHVENLAFVSDDFKMIVPILTKELISCMERARYDVDYAPHMAIGDYYTHGSSEVRRDIDFFNSSSYHACYLEKNPLIKENNIKKYSVLAIIHADRANKMELISEEIESRIKRIDTIKYFQNCEQDEFVGVVSKILSWEMEIQFENGLKGIVPYSTLGDGILFDGRMVYSPTTGVYYQLFDQLRLRKKDYSLEFGDVYFDVVEKVKENPFFHNSEEKIKKMILRKNGD